MTLLSEFFRKKSVITKRSVQAILYRCYWVAISFTVIYFKNEGTMKKAKNNKPEKLRTVKIKVRKRR